MKRRTAVVPYPAVSRPCPPLLRLQFCDEGFMKLAAGKLVKIALVHSARDSLAGPVMSTQGALEAKSGSGRWRNSDRKVGMSKSLPSCQ